MPFIVAQFLVNLFTNAPVLVPPFVMGAWHDARRVLLNEGNLLGRLFTQDLDRLWRKALQKLVVEGPRRSLM